MFLSHSLVALTLVYVSLLFKPVLVASQCSQKFMGPNCIYRCNNDCNGGKCHRGYFGPYCQYLDVLNDTVQSYQQLVDQNYSTCLDIENKVDQVELALPRRRFTFMELIASSRVFSKISVLYLSTTTKGEASYQACDSEQRDEISDHREHIYCGSLELFSGIRLSGGGVRYLCDIHVSGGRNMLLKAKYIWTSKHPAFSSTTQLTDGVVPRSSSGENINCYHSEGLSDTQPTLTFTLPAPSRLFHFVIHNRHMLMGRLDGFNLQTYNSTGLVMHHEDQRRHLGLVVHLAHSEPHALIERVVLYLNNPNRKTPLQICEVEAWGDCLPFKAGLSCELWCDSSCTDEKCDILGRCITCPKGQYGDKQCKECPDGCASGTNDDTKCDRNGTCLYGCKLQHYGPQCKKICTACNPKFGCTINGTCIVCAPKLMGHDCTEECPTHCGWDGACNRTSGHCFSGCKSGYFNVRCEAECPKTCLNKSCDIVDESCYFGCEQGYYGIKCEKICPSLCLDALCDQQGGNCLAGCLQGYHGLKCEQNCPLQCGGNRSCHQSSSACLEGCVSGFYGERCGTKCANCTGACDKKTGECEKECNPGFYGSRCDMICHNCGGNTSCDRVTGECTEGCTPGFTGMFCKTECTKNCEVCGNTSKQCIICKAGFYNNCQKVCKEVCESSKRCHSMTGNCYYPCEKKKYGKECSKDCPPNCGGDGACSSESGECSRECQTGYFGIMCLDKCDSSCGDSNVSCEFLTGKCLGCPAGWAGAHCTQKCYNCIGNVCDQMTLACLRGCHGGVCGEGNSSIVVTLIAMSVVIVIIFAAVWLLRIKRTSGEKE